MIESPAFDKLRNWIREALENRLTWDEIRLAGQENVEALEGELQRRIKSDWWPKETTVQVWLEVVQSMEEAEKKRLELSYRNNSILITDKSEDNGVRVPTDRYTSWVMYKQHLISSGWRQESIDEMEQSTVKLLNRLSKDTGESGPVKGLVVGHVQSGKTANMAALMAMAADWGWNMFIVLSGTIENLRKQTQARLFSDLYRDGCNIRWYGLEHLSLQSPHGQRAQDLKFNSNTDRFFTVCLKHPKRLENLIKWLQADPNKYAQMKIIVIDDESDQGGVNTAKISNNERSRINKLIVNLVDGKRYDNKEAKGAPAAMNYIGYTATPYANFLNESGRESLYPQNFIRTLQPSAEYFGARQIFGIDGTEDSDGLNILRTVEEQDLKIVVSLHKGESTFLPSAALDATAWFLCAVSAMRLRGYKKPISMLVHTSQQQTHHQHVADAIERLFSSTASREDMIDRCRLVWERETSDFTVDDFKEQFSTYPGLEHLEDYPSFEEIRTGIHLLMSDISHIPLNEEGILAYHAGIHLCIDNCANNGVTDDNMVVRLAYPEGSSSSPDYPSPAPAFIVVGGSTLSRGLTIEGLVSTFFLRSAGQADSLMQMGRWFGYRKNYELYPRIWMTAKTISQFRFLAQLEYELRDDLLRYMHLNADPSDCGPKIMSSSKTVALRITAANKMQGAIAAEMDFSGINNQTVVFSEDKEVLDHNIHVTEEFLAGLVSHLGPGTMSGSGESVVWRKVPFQLIKEGLLLGKYKAHERASVFNQIEAFCEWFEKSEEEAGYTPWNIVVGGIKTESLEEKDIWHVPGGRVGKINRSRLKKASLDGVSIGVLRAPKDLYEDIEVITDEIKANLNKFDNDTVRRMRDIAGLANTPLLILYRINKDSKAPKKNEDKESGNQRLDLGVPSDIIGMSIWIPGTKSKSLVKTLTVKIDKQMQDDEAGDLNED